MTIIVPCSPLPEQQELSWPSLREAWGRRHGLQKHASPHFSLVRPRLIAASSSLHHLCAPLPFSITPTAHFNSTFVRHHFHELSLLRPTHYTCASSFTTPLPASLGCCDAPRPQISAPLCPNRLLHGHAHVRFINPITPLSLSPLELFAPHSLVALPQPPHTTINMSSKLDTSLDDILKTRRQTNKRGRGGRRSDAARPAPSGPVGGVSKSAKPAKQPRSAPSGSGVPETTGKILVSGLVSHFHPMRKSPH
jgi:hypothetical protein